MFETHMFWAYGNLRQLEQIAAASFVRQGYKLNLWTYGTMSNAPQGVRLRDAREILPESSVFLNQRSSYAGFSDLFRYAVLTKAGGLYADTDVIALKPVREMQTTPFLVTERPENGLGNQVIISVKSLFQGVAAFKINGNVIFNPSPCRGDIVDLAYAYSERFPKTEIRWAEIGPDLLNAITKIFPHHGFEVKPPDFANPVNWWDCPGKLLRPHYELRTDAAFLHCFTERWRIAGVDLDKPYPDGSLMARLLRDHIG